MDGDVWLYVREDISSNLLSIEMKPIKGFNVELNLGNKKYFIHCSYKPHENMIGYHPRAPSENIVYIHLLMNDLLFWENSM